MSLLTAYSNDHDLLRFRRPCTRDLDLMCNMISIRQSPLPPVFIPSPKLIDLRLLPECSLMMECIALVRANAPLSSTNKSFHTSTRHGAGVRLPATPRCTTLHRLLTQSLYGDIMLAPDDHRTTCT
ncbi:hypothetical protein FRC12_019895 [Ceratobasidium sp. 428]|nr:hypothetical protein FRC12_019895 [Ceratobasidium sp. 428]